MSDYERALFYIQNTEWDNLLILMVRTKDQFLAKKIEHFLHAYYYAKKKKNVEEKLLLLLKYLDFTSCRSTEL
jgi:hypothetical protein